MQIVIHAGDAAPRIIEVVAGANLMEVLRNAGIAGIEAECGGCLTCGTCSVYIRADWFGRLPTADAAEEEMLEYALHPGPTMRLACQITLDASHDGLELLIPESQR